MLLPIKSDECYLTDDSDLYDRIDAGSVLAGSMPSDSSICSISSVSSPDVSESARNVAKVILACSPKADPCGIRVLTALWPGTL